MNIFHDPLSEEAKVREQPKKASRFHLPRSLRGKVALLIGVLVVIGISTVVVINLRHKASASGSCVAFNPPVQVSTTLTVVAPIQTQLVAPTGLTVIPSDRTNTLSWTAVSGATGYNIYRSTNAGGASYPKIATTTSPTISPTISFTDNNGLTNGTTYYYEVTATAGTNWSGMSSVVSGTPVAPVAPIQTQLVAPQNLSVTPGNATNTLSWNPVTGATVYNIYRSTAPGVEAYLRSVNTLIASFVDTGLTYGQPYYYQVTATAGTIQSARSAEVIGTPVGPGPGTGSTGTVGSVGCTKPAPGVVTDFRTNADSGTPIYTYAITVTSQDTCDYNFTLTPNYHLGALPLGWTYTTPYRQLIYNPSSTSDYYHTSYYIVDITPTPDVLSLNRDSITLVPLP